MTPDLSNNDMEPVGLITLRDGVAVPFEALRLGWELERRGFTFRIDGNTLVVAPRSKLTTIEIEGLRKFRADLFRLVKHTWEAA